MKYLKLYENFDWSDDDFDYEEESSVEIIGNQYFTDFLVKRDLYDKFVKSSMKCHHGGIHILSIKDINHIIQNEGSLYNVINYLINWECAYSLIKVGWILISIKWNKLCKRNPLYKIPEL